MLLPLLLFGADPVVAAGPMQSGDTRRACSDLLAEAARLDAEAQAAVLAAARTRMRSLRAASTGVAALAPVPLVSEVAGRAVMGAATASAVAAVRNGVDPGEASRTRSDLLTDLARLKGCAMPDDADR